MRCRVFVGVAIAMLGYILLGGLVFHLLESNNEDETIRETLEAFQDLIQNHSCLSRDELESVIQMTYSAFRRGLYLDELDEPPPKRWEYGTACLFCTIVVTTIGYGGIAPSTSIGRIFCVIYALVGIPLCLVYVSALGRQLFKASERLCIRASSCRHRKWVPLLAYILLGGLFSIWMAAVIFGFVENWAYKDAVYFIFITLSTIGFGDFIPVGANLDDAIIPLYLIFVPTWIWFGLAWLSLIINRLQTAIEDKLSATENDRAPQEIPTVCGNQVMAVSACPDTNTPPEEL